jgi:hypothetical protein
MATPMSIAPIVPEPHPRANLAALLVSEIRTSRRLRLHLRYAVEKRRALADALHAAVATIADLSRTVDRARSTSQALRDELRRYTAARVPAPTRDDDQPSAPGVH